MVKVLRDADLYLAAIGLVYVCVVTFCLMLARYVYSISLPGLEEITMIVFVWFLYFSMIYCVRKDEHIRVEVLDMILNPPLRMLTSVLANLVLLVFTAVMCYYSMRLVSFNIGRRGGITPVMDIPYYLVYLVLPISFGIFTLFVTMHILRDVRALRVLMIDSIAQDGKGEK